MRVTIIFLLRIYTFIILIPKFCLLFIFVIVTISYAFSFISGLLSDTLAKRWHLSGRILVHFILICLEGIFLVGFSFGLNTNLPSAIVLMVLFSFFVQAVCGSTFSIVPFVDPLNTGKVMGMVGAGGNIGGIIFNLMFRQFQPDFESAFLCLGCITLGAGIAGTLVLCVQGKTIWHLFNGRYI